MRGRPERAVPRYDAAVHRRARLALSLFSAMGVAAGVAGCVAAGPVYSHPARDRCEAIERVLYDEVKPRVSGIVKGLELDLLTGELIRGKDQSCAVLGIWPHHWSRVHSARPAEMSIDLEGTGSRTFSVYRVEFLERPTDSEFLERHELAPFRMDATVEREDRGADRQTLVIRHDGELRLLVLRWHARDRHYLRCEARLRGRFERALPLFEALCAENRVPAWEGP